MYEQDYIMRLIKEMVRTLLKLLFNVDTDSPSAVLFYANLNNKSDTFLEQHNFSRDEIKSGLRDVVEKYEGNDFADMFLE